MKHLRLLSVFILLSGLLQPVCAMAQVAGVSRQIALGKNADGRLELFALGGDGAVNHKWQAAPNRGWGEWSTLAGHDLKQIAIGSNADGRLEIFALGGDGAVYHKWQGTPNGGWGEWKSLGYPMAPAL